MHEQYGDVVRIGPNKLSFRTAQAIHDIYTDRKANLIKTGWTHIGEKTNPTYTTHSVSDRNLHAGRRRLLNNAFSDRALNDLHKYIDTEIRRWCHYLDQGVERDVSVWSTLLAVDVLGELCFGKSFDAMKNGGTYLMGLLMETSKFSQRVRADR
jgi:cytochrome P450